MAPTPRPAVHRLAGLLRAAELAAQHLLLAIVVDGVAAVAHVPVMARVTLTVGLLAGHWWLRDRDRSDLRSMMTRRRLGLHRKVDP